MKKLFDRTFWKFFSVFILILLFSFSFLIAMGAYRKANEALAAIKAAFPVEKSVQK